MQRAGSAGMVLYTVAGGFGLAALALLVAAAVGARKMLHLTRYGLRLPATVTDPEERVDLRVPGAEWRRLP